MGFIFFNSALPGDESSSLSEAIISLLLRITDVFSRSWLVISLQNIFLSGWFHIFIRKLAHFAVFGILGLLAWSSLGIFPKIRYKAFVRAGLATGFCLIYAISDEVHQLFVPGRVGAILDVLIDVWGAFILTFVLAGFVYLFNRMSKKKAIGKMND